MTQEKLQKITRTPGKTTTTPGVTLSPYLKPSKHESKLVSENKETDKPKLNETEAPISIKSKFLEKLVIVN